MKNEDESQLSFLLSTSQHTPRLHSQPIDLERRHGPAMLRDLPYRDSSDEQVFMNAVPVSEETTTAPSGELFDDIFGSAPSSPILSARNDAEVGDIHRGSSAARAEHSDIARLRSIHSTNGYREGIAVSKEQHIQAGFDEGYSLGGEIGLKAGWLLGVLEGLVKAIRRLDTEQNTQLIERVQKLYAESQETLKVEKLLGPDHFGPDGIWKFDVPGQDEEAEMNVTFADVAANHPVLVEWKAKVDGISRTLGLTLKQ